MSSVVPVLYKKPETHPADSKGNLSCLVYGEPGSGKSWFASTWPNALFIDVDDGLSGLRLHGRISSWVDVESYSTVRQVVTAAKGGAFKPDVETIVLDGLGEITHILSEELRKEKSNVKAGRVRMTKELWGYAVDDVRMLIRDIANLKEWYNVVVTAHAIIEKDEMRGGMVVVPSTIGKFAQTVAGYFDWLLYSEASTEWVTDPATNMGRNEGRWRLHTIKYGNFPAKDRLDVLSPEEPNDFKVLIDKVNTARADSTNRSNT